jgi:hypothetical protein
MPWVIGTLAIFALGTNLFPYLLPHYLAAVTCLFLLVSVTGLRQLNNFSFRGIHPGKPAAQIILFLCAAHFIFWYGLHLFEGGATSNALNVNEALQYETWDAINHAGPQKRMQVAAQLAAHAGKQLLFVRYSPQHRFQDEWVWNPADFDSSRVVMARDLGAAENEKLRRYYHDRSVWLLEPDSTPPSLTPYTAPAPATTPGASPPSSPFTDVK